MFSYLQISKDLIVFIPHIVSIEKDMTYFTVSINFSSPINADGVKILKVSCQNKEEIDKLFESYKTLVENFYTK